VKRALLPVAALALFTLAGCTGQVRGGVAAAAVGEERPDSGITAQGAGEVTGRPDTLTVVLGVETRGPKAQDALAANNDKANALIDTLKNRGVEAKDMQTSQLSIYPTFDDKGRRITGYQVNNQVTARLRDLKEAGALIDAAAAAVGDAVRVQQLSFSIDDDSALRAEARTKAVRQAQAQAKEMAEAAGVKLGRLRSITEARTNGPRPFPYAGDTAGRDGQASAPIEPGTQELTLMVTVAYDIAQ
jgi:uncharacterized protein